MSDSPRGFLNSEFEERTRRAQKLMQQAGFAALWFTTEPEIRYFTGFFTQFWQSPTRPWFVILPSSGKPIAIIPEIGAALMAQTWIDDIRTWQSPHPVDDGIGLLSAALAEVALDGDIGMPMGPETALRMPLLDFERLKSSLSNRFVDASAIVRHLRSIKSPAETAKIEEACARAGRAFQALPHLIRPGTPLDQVFRKFRGACLNAGLDDVPYVAGGAGPIGYADVISPPSSKGLEMGDVLMLDTGAMFDGYFCDFDHNFAIGPVHDKVHDAHKRLFEAIEVGLEAAKPDAVCADLFHAMNSVLNAGESNVGRMGHGLGMQLTEWPSITSWDQTKLRPGMVLTLEPSIETESGQMLVAEEDIVITRDGCRLLTKRVSDPMRVIR